MVYLTKRITMTEAAWKAVRIFMNEAAWESQRNLARRGLQSLDVRDAITALAEADVIAETVNPAEEPTSEIDAWVIDAQHEGRDVK